MHGSTAATKRFNPRKISGCQCWLRSDLGITLNGSTVSSWVNQVTGISGDASQPTAGNQPSYNGSGGLNNRPRITIAAGQGFEWPLDLQGAMTVVMVYKLSALPAAGTGEYGMHVIKGSTGPVISGRDRLNAAAGYTDRNFLFSYGASVASVGVSVAVGTAAEIDIVTYNGGAVSTAANYTDTLNGAAQAVVSSGVFGDLRTNLGSLGCYVNSSHVISASMIGDIYEVIVYNRVLDVNELADLWGYLKLLYGL